MPSISAAKGKITAWMKRAIMPFIDMTTPTFWTLRPSPPVEESGFTAWEKVEKDSPRSSSRKMGSK